MTVKLCTLCISCQKLTSDTKLYHYATPALQPHTQSYLKKQEKIQINYLTLHLKQLEKEQKNPQS